MLVSVSFSSRYAAKKEISRLAWREELLVNAADSLPFKGINGVSWAERDAKVLKASISLRAMS